MGKIRQIFMALCMPVALILAGQSALYAGQWHSSNQVTWTVGKACRDGAIITALYALPPITILSEQFDAHLYLEQFEQYPVLTDPESYKPTEVGDLIGVAEVPRQPTKSTPLIIDFGSINIYWDYTIAHLYWDSQLPVGKVVTLNWHAIEAKQFILAVEDCYIAPDAATKSPELSVKATVGLESDSCTNASTIVAKPLKPVYACLVIENQGDVTFDTHELADELYGINTSFALTITPGAQISITHTLAQEAGLPFSLGPFADAHDATDTFSWQATGGDQSLTKQALIQIDRNNPLLQYQYLPIVKQN